MSGRILAGRYELFEKIGDGGMAVVYKAKDRLLNRNVAIKILKPEFIRDPKFIDNFRRESQAAAGLSHPNIVAVYDVGKEGNIYYIVMELVDKGNLSDIIEKQAPLNERHVIDISRQIATALSFAHKKNLIHRDVKPHNILMAEDGTFKIADFGIARAVNKGTLVNNTNVVMGSVHYLSPEQARGSAVDARSDIYSLGILMYEMLTGRVPFDGENAVAVALMHMNDSVPAPSISNPAVSSFMDAIVLKATNKQPDQRFASADEMISALDDAEKGMFRNAEEVSGLYANEPFKYEGGRDDIGEVPEYSFETDDYTDYSEYKKRGERISYVDNDIFGGGFTEGYSGDVPQQEPYRQESQERQVRAHDRGGRDAEARERSDGRKKNGKLPVVAAIILAVICAVPLSLLLLNVFANFGDQSVEIPKVLGCTQEQAVKLLEVDGLGYRIGNSILSDTYDEGLVAAVDPQEGTKVRKGYNVTLMLSRGKSEESKPEEAEKVAVPDVTGDKLSTARTEIEGAKLKVGSVSYEFSDSVKEDIVIRTDPVKNSEVDEGSEVDIVVSKGKEVVTVSVPGLSGVTENKAKSALEGVGLKLGSVTSKESEEVKDTVIDQSIKEGTMVEEGTVVDIVLSAGPAEAEPVPVQYTIDYDEAKSEIFTLTVTVTDSNGLHYIVNNSSRKRSDGSETVTLRGTGEGTVRVIMDDEIIYEGKVDFTTGELKN